MLKVTISIYDAVPTNLGIELNFPQYAHMLSSQHLVRGARARVVKGPSRNLIGKIVDVVQSVASLWFWDDGTVSSFPLEYLELHFVLGDNIRIICGERKDIHGCMCSLVDIPSSQYQDANVVVFLNQTRELVCCQIMVFHDLIYVVSQDTIPKTYIAFDLQSQTHHQDPMMFKTVEIIDGPNKGY